MVVNPFYKMALKKLLFLPEEQDFRSFAAH